jgi:hypothetical protein
MKNEKDEKKHCANEGCPRPAEKGEDFCETCGLEWSLLRREQRRYPHPVSREVRS